MLREFNYNNPPIRFSFETILAYTPFLLTIQGAVQAFYYMLNAMFLTKYELTHESGPPTIMEGVNVPFWVKLDHGGKMAEYSMAAFSWNAAFWGMVTLFVAGVITILLWSRFYQDSKFAKITVWIIGVFLALLHVPLLLAITKSTYEVALYLDDASVPYLPVQVYRFALYATTATGMFTIVMVGAWIINVFSPGGASNSEIDAQIAQDDQRRYEKEQARLQRDTLYELRKQNKR